MCPARNSRKGSRYCGSRYSPYSAVRMPTCPSAEATNSRSSPMTFPLVVDGVHHPSLPQFSAHFLLSVNRKCARNGVDGGRWLLADQFDHRDLPAGLLLVLG